MSVYNEKKIWIEKAVESILNQTHMDFEFIIVIDNPAINLEIKEYLIKTQNSDARIKLLWNEKNIGLAKSLNLGLEAAIGEYIARMDADDISLLNRLEMELKYIQNNDFQLISANKINIDENGMELFRDIPIKRNPNKVLIYSNIIVHPLVLVKTDIVRKLGGYRALANSEDLDLWLRMVDQGYKLGILDEYLLYYRIRPNSASIGRQLEQYYTNKYIIQLHQERLKNNNKDSFSVEGQTIFLKKKNITEYKKKKFAKSNLYLLQALTALNKNKIKCIKCLMKSFFYFPLFTLDKIRNYYCSNMNINRKTDNK